MMRQRWSSLHYDLILFVKRDLYVRFRDSIKIMVLFLIYAIIAIAFLYNQPLSNGKESVLVDVTFYRFFHGVDFVDLSYFYKEGDFLSLFIGYSFKSLLCCL